MAVWMVRAGRMGEEEALALEKGVTTIGWDELPDLSLVDSKDAMRALIEENNPDAPKGRISNFTGQVWGFKGRIQEGDYVVMPLKARSAVAVGRVTGPYAYREDFPSDARHTRTVNWLRDDIPRTAFGQDLLQSLGAFLTVCSIKRNEAEERIKAIVETGKDPHLHQKSALPASSQSDEADEEEAALDLESYARDQIRAHITANFKGHEFTRLVDEVLKAQGYHTKRMPPGPDGGVDILAGSGPMGFETPRLAVQVKSSESPENVNTLRELQGIMKTFSAQQGLLVSWGGFKETVYREARPLFFELRLWDADDFLAALLGHYDKLDDTLQAELPLKRVWTLVLED